MNSTQHIPQKPGKATWFLVLLPLFFLLHMVTEYYPMLTMQDLLMPATAWLLGIPVMLYMFFRAVKPNWVSLATLAFYAEVVFFFFLPIHIFFTRYIPLLGHYKVLLPLLVIAAIVLFVVMKRRKAPPMRFFLYLNVLLTLFVVMEVVKLTIKATPVKHLVSSTSNKDLPQLPPCDSCIKPDVYFIVFDEYAASSSLKSYFQYDNSALDSFFINRGFYYAQHSKSNYNFTTFSIGSILNMDYHNTTFDDKIDLLFYIKGMRTIEHNRVCRLFQQRGYSIINQSFFPIPGDEPRQSLGILTNKQTILLTPTLYSKIMLDIGWNLSRDQPDSNSQYARAIVKNNRNSLQQTKKTYNDLLTIAGTLHPQPVFVYSHFLLPHDPYLFDSTGQVTPEASWYGIPNEKESYLSQLKYSNTLIQQLAARLQQPGNRPRVVIIQSDHGYRSFPQELKQLEFNNLNAIYFSDGQYSGLYDSISSVNTFRVILHKYFNAPLPLIKDSTVYIRH